MIVTAILKSLQWIDKFKPAILLAVFHLCLCSQNIAQNLSMDGAFKLYYLNSKNLFVKGLYIDSLASGEWKFYDQSGALLAVHNCRNEQLNDSFKTFYQKKIKVKGFYKDNKKQGLWTTYDQFEVWGTRYCQNDTLIGIE